MYCVCACGVFVAYVWCVYLVFVWFVVCVFVFYVRCVALLPEVFFCCTPLPCCLPFLLPGHIAIFLEFPFYGTFLYSIVADGYFCFI